MNRRSLQDYFSMLAGLFPPGQAWNSGQDGALAGLNRAAAEELARVDGEAFRLLDEGNPASTVNALSDWERVCGLPDQCSALASTFEERRAQVLIKLVRPVGQHAAYYESIARTLGYQNPQVEEFLPFRARFRAGDRVNQAPGGVVLEEPGGGLVVSNYHGWLFTWRLNVESVAVRYFRAGQSMAGDRLAVWGDAMLECMVARFKPAHTNVLFAYGEEASAAFVCESCGAA